MFWPILKVSPAVFNYDYGIFNQFKKPVFFSRTYAARWDPNLRPFDLKAMELKPPWLFLEFRNHLQIFFCQFWTLSDIYTQVSEAQQTEELWWGRTFCQWPGFPFLSYLCGEARPQYDERSSKMVWCSYEFWTHWKENTPQWSYSRRMW